MNCEEVRDLLVAYLDDEVTPSEQRLLRDHLAGCPDCQSEMAALRKAQSRVQQSLKAEADRVIAPPHAWSLLQARLAAEGGAVHQTPAAGGSRVDEGRTTLKTRQAPALGALALAAVLALGVATVVLVPPARAAVEELLTGLIRMDWGGGAAVMPVEFVPLAPEYIPEGLDATHFVEGGEPGAAFMEFRFFDPDRFVVIYQEPAGDDASLPEGAAVTVNGHEAALLTGLSGTVYLASPEPQPGRPMPTRGGGGGSIDPTLLPEQLNYTDGRMLAWVQDGLYVEILTNLSEAELLQIAGSMVPAEQLPPEAVPPQAMGGGGPSSAPPVAPDEQLTFTPLEPTYQPADFGVSGGVTIFDAAGAQITELRYYGAERFVILTERVAADDSLGAGEPVTVGGLPATLESGLEGVAYLVVPMLQDGQSGPGGGGGGSGGGGGGGPAPEDATPRCPPDCPDTIAFVNGSRLVWVLDGIRVEMLTNLPLEEQMRVAESLTPRPY
jgi:hypothetical protein